MKIKTDINRIDHKTYDICVFKMCFTCMEMVDNRDEFESLIISSRAYAEMYQYHEFRHEN